MTLSCSTAPTARRLQRSAASIPCLPTAAPNVPWTAVPGTPNPAYTFTESLSALTALNNAATVYFRLTDNDTTSANGGVVGTGGTDRVDNVTVTGTSVPEPGSIVLAATGAVGLVIALRRRPLLDRSCRILLDLTRGGTVLARARFAASREAEKADDINSLKRQPSSQCLAARRTKLFAQRGPYRTRASPIEPHVAGPRRGCTDAQLVRRCVAYVIEPLQRRRPAMVRSVLVSAEAGSDTRVFRDAICRAFLQLPVPRVRCFFENALCGVLFGRHPSPNMDFISSRPPELASTEFAPPASLN